MNQISYEDAYGQAKQGLLEMFYDVENPMANFKKDTYESAFLEYIKKHKGTLEAMEAAYSSSENPEAFCRELAMNLADSAEERLQAIGKKSKCFQQQMNYNMMLAIYVFPALTDGRKEAREAVADAVVETWNSRFQANVSKSTYEGIYSGFQKKLCYITTAVCASQGKADDCYELTMLRNYRDEILLSTEDGKKLVEEYYNIAPTIVNRINKQEDAEMIYKKIWETYLNPCIRDIENHRGDACKARYMDMVMELKGRYII